MTRTWLASAVLLAAHGAAAQSPRPDAAGSRPLAPAAVVRLEYVADTLPNGLRVVYHVDRSTPVVAVEVWYDVGAKHEVPGRTGLAHLFEHMMFKGSRNVADGQHHALLAAAGAAGVNGGTSTDWTSYVEQVPSNQLELALWMEADRMGTLLETLDQKKLDNQREVVKNERRESIDNQPYGSSTENLMAAAFPVTHPYHHAILGSLTDLSAASLDDVRRFFRTYYAPNNAVLVMAGDFELTDAQRLVRKHFAAISRGPAIPPRQSAALPPLLGSAQRQVVRDANAPSPAVFMAFRVPTARDSGWATVPLLASVLADGKSSRLYNSLVRERQLATDVFGSNVGLLDGADLLIFGATGRPGVDPVKLEHALQHVIDSARAGVSQHELDRVRAGARFRFVDGLQQMREFNGRADMLAQGAINFHDPNWVNTVLPHYDAVTVNQLRALATERLVPTNRVTVVYVPARTAGTSRVTP
jgi:zinc protease